MQTSEKGTFLFGDWLPGVSVLPQATGCSFHAVSFPVPLEFSVMKSKHFAGLGCFFFCWLLIEEESRKWNCPFPPLHKLLIFLLAFDFLLGLIGSTEKRGNLGTLSLFQTSTSVLLFQSSQQEQRGAQIWHKLVPKFPRLDMHHYTSSLPLTTFPSLCGSPENTLLLFACQEMCLCPLLFLLYLQLLKTNSHKSFYTAEWALPAKRPSLNMFVVNSVFTNSLDTIWPHTHPHSLLSWLIWSTTMLSWIWYSETAEVHRSGFPPRTAVRSRTHSVNVSIMFRWRSVSVCSLCQRERQQHCNHYKP